MRRESVIVFLVLVGVSGCQRGCLSAWITGQGGPGPASSSDLRSAPLAAFDCPDGLVRCRNGMAQASKLGSIPANCTPSADKPAACECPFVDVASCFHGCVLEDLTLVSPPPEALRACALSPGVGFSTPATGAYTPIRCEGQGARFRCEHDVVAACTGASAQPVSTCTIGCVHEGEELDEEQVDIGMATALMCAREIQR